MMMTMMMMMMTMFYFLFVCRLQGGLVLRQPGGR